MDWMLKLKKLKLLLQLIFLILSINVFGGCSPSKDGNSSFSETQMRTLVDRPFSAILDDWPHSISDIPPAHRVKYGRLKNGLRYAILPVKSVTGEVSIQLNVSVGFEDEPEGLFGIAHLLEHMAFRGANGNKEPSIIHDFQTQGVELGTDFNGFTSYQNTVFHVNLASGKNDSVNTALQNISKLAIEPNLTSENLEVEKKVVLSELKLRNNVSYRAWKDTQRFKFFDRTRHAEPGIGTIESLAAITIKDIKTFHKRHYHPENAIIVIAGDVHILKTEKKLKKLFSIWTKSQHQQPKEEKDIDLDNFPKVRHFQEKGAQTQLKLFENTVSTLRNDTRLNRRQHFAERMANVMIKNRLTPRIEAQSSVNWINLYKIRTNKYDIQSVTMGANNYIIASKLFETERLRALKYGFRDDEIAYALKQEKALLERQNENPSFISVQSEATRLRESYIEGKVYNSFIQQSSFMKVDSEALSTKDYHEAAKRMWADFNPRYWTQSKSSMKRTVEQVQKNFEELSKFNISEPKLISPKTLKNENFNKGRILSQNIFSKGKIHRLLYENGARLNYQHRKTEEDDIQVVVTLRGDFSEFRPRYEAVSEQVTAFSRADIKGLSKSEIDRQFVDQKTEFSIKMRGHRLDISASTKQKDLDASLQIISTFITDVDIQSKFRKQSFTDILTKVKAASQSSPSIAGALKIPYAYSGKANSFLSEIGGHYSDEEKTLNSIEDIIKAGIIEVGVVGDFDENALKESFASSLGALPLREKKLDLNQKSPEGLDVVTHIDPGVTNLVYKGTNDQMATFFCWPHNSVEKSKYIMNGLSAKIINNRILHRFREELGVTYSPRIFEHENSAFPEFSFTCFSIQFSPENETTINVNFKRILDELISKPITKTELTRAREPIISSFNRYGGGNQILVQYVAAAHSSPDRLIEHLEYIQILKRMSLKTINQYISQKYVAEGVHVFRVQAPVLTSHEKKQKALEVGVVMGRPDAQYKLGVLLKRRLQDGDEQKALRLFTKSAEQNYVPAHRELGRYYALARKDLKKAVHHLELSEGNKEGFFLLADIYFRNPKEFPHVSEMRIMELYHLSADDGYKYAQQALARRYKDGSIVKRDPVEALMWAILSTSPEGSLVKDTDSSYLQRYKKGLSKSEQKNALIKAENWILNHKGIKKDDF